MMTILSTTATTWPDVALAVVSVASTVAIFYFFSKL